MYCYKNCETTYNTAVNFKDVGSIFLKNCLKMSIVDMLKDNEICCIIYWTQSARQTFLESTTNFIKMASNHHFLLSNLFMHYFYELILVTILLGHTINICYTVRLQNILHEILWIFSSLNKVIWYDWIYLFLQKRR